MVIDSIKAMIRPNRVGKKKPIRKLVDRPYVPLPTVWIRLIALDDNKLPMFCQKLACRRSKSYLTI